MTRLPTQPVHVVGLECRPSLYCACSLYLSLTGQIPVGMRFGLLLGLSMRWVYTYRLPSIEDYCFRNLLLGIQPVMSKNRFLSLWHFLHCDDNTEITDLSDVTCKVRTVLSTLSSNFLARYNPSQELSVDEMMVKYKGRKGGKIKMSRKPVKLDLRCGAALARVVVTFAPFRCTTVGLLIPLAIREGACK